MPTYNATPFGVGPFGPARFLYPDPASRLGYETTDRIANFMARAVEFALASLTTQPNRLGQIGSMKRGRTKRGQ